MLLKSEEPRFVREVEDIYHIMQRILSREEKIDMSKEHFWTIALSPASKIVNIELVFIGSFRTIEVDPPEVFSIPLQKKAESLILIHNNPSGSLEPSEADMEATNRLIKVGEICKVEVRDHVILTTQSYFSFAEAGLMEKLKWSVKYALPFIYEKQVAERTEALQYTISKKDALLKQQQAMLQEKVAQAEAKKKRDTLKAIAIQMLKLGRPTEEIKQLTGLNATQIGKLRSELLVKP